MPNNLGWQVLPVTFYFKFSTYLHIYLKDIFLKQYELFCSMQHYNWTLYYRYIVLILTSTHII